MQIASLGFRGEALSSISAVSQVELITKTPESSDRSPLLHRRRYRERAGGNRRALPAPHFLVHHLFYNTPARAKFLKSATAEGNSVSTVVEQLALSHPEISFKYIQNGQNKLYTSGNGNLKEIVYQIYGRRADPGAGSPWRLRQPLHVYPAVLSAIPSVARGNRNFENYFVNGRYVKSRLLARAIEDGYHGFMMQHRYPFTLAVSGNRRGKGGCKRASVSKMELRFSSQEELYHQLCLALQNALLERENGFLQVSLDTGRIFRSKEPDVIRSQSVNRPGSL